MGAATQLAKWLRGRSRPERWMGWSDTAYQKQSYQQRLLLVQRHLSESLDVAPCGTVRILSMFAGDGRDVVNVLGKHPRRGEVLAWLVEQNSQSVASGIRRSAEVGLGTATTFLEKDATQYAAYHGLAPAHIVLLCGVWGHVPIRERGQLIQALASLCARWRSDLDSRHLEGHDSIATDPRALSRESLGTGLHSFHSRQRLGRGDISVSRSRDRPSGAWPDFPISDRCGHVVATPRLQSGFHKSRKRCSSECTEGIAEMKAHLLLPAIVLIGTLPGCGRKTISRPLTIADLAQIYEHECVEFQTVCRNRDEQVKVVAELEKIDLESRGANPEKTHAEIAKLEDYLQRLNEEISVQANRVADAKLAVDKAGINQK